MPLQSTTGAFSINGYKAVSADTTTPIYQQVQLITTSTAMLSEDGVALSGDSTRLVIGSDGLASIYLWNGTNYVIEQTITSTVTGFGRSVALNSDGTYMAVASRSGTPVLPAKLAIYTRSGTTWTLQQELSSTFNNGFIQRIDFSQNADYVVFAVGGPGAPTGGLIFNRSGTTWTYQNSAGSGTGGVSINATGDIVISGQNTNALVIRRIGSSWSTFKTLPNSGVQPVDVDISDDGNYILAGRIVYYPVLDYNSSSTVSGMQQSDNFMSGDGNYIFETSFKRLFLRNVNSYNFYTTLNPIPNLVFNGGSITYLGDRIAAIGVFGGTPNNKVYIFKKI